MNSGPFTHFQSFYYWSGTEYAPNTAGAWSFNTDDGSQVSSNKGSTFYAIAVHPGDIAAVPEPETYALMVAGLALVGVAARRRIKR